MTQEIFKEFSELYVSVKWKLQSPLPSRLCYTEWFATTIFSATHIYNIVATLFRTVATLFQHCNVVLCKKLLLQIFLSNITFDEHRLLRGGNLKASLTSYDLLQHSVLDAWGCTLNASPCWQLIMTDYIHYCSNFYNVLFRAVIASFFSSLRKQLSFCIMLPLFSP